MSIKKIVSYNGYKGIFEVDEPIGGKLSKNKLDRVDKGRLEVTKGKGSRMGVSVDGVGTGGGVKEIGEEVSYRYL